MSAQEMWDTPKVCETLGCAPRTVYKYVAKGWLRAHKVGRKNFFYPPDVMHFIGTSGNSRLGEKAC